MFFPIRFKLIVGGILTVLLPMAVCGYVAVTDSMEVVSRLSKTNEQFIAEGTAMQVAATVEGEMKFTAAFAARTQVKSVAEAVNAKGINRASEAVNSIREDIKKRFELLNANYGGIFITDKAGTTYAEAVDAGENLKSWDIPNHATFLEAKTTRKTATSDIVRSLGTNEPVMVFYSPIFSDNGAFLGVVGTLLRAKVITSIVSNRKNGATGYCFMINQAGIVIAHPDETYILRLDLNKVPGMEAISQSMLDGRAGAETYIFKGIDKVAGFVPVRHKGWSIAATQNADEFFAGVHSLKNSIIVIILFSLMITCTIIFLAATSLTQPLRSVINGLDDIANRRRKTDLVKRIDITSTDEIGILSQKFNSLMESIDDAAIYKKVIEEEHSLEEVYQRLGEVISGKIGARGCFIYQADHARQGMSLTFPRHDQPNELPCRPEILDQSDLCKANRTGHIISSALFPAVCRQFIGREPSQHYCFPIVCAGASVAVVMLTFDAPCFPADIAARDARIFQAEAYINESLAVIETKRLMSSLRESALVDELTGMYNRRYLQEFAEKMVAVVLRRGKSIGLLMCDLDYFKQVNDTYGHQAGDLVLKESSRVIRRSVRESDLVIRFGGEEFLILLLDVNEGESMVIAEKIRLQIEQLTIKLPEAAIHKTISVGVSEFPQDTNTLWSCIKYADVALYRAKEEGRNRCVRFTKEMWIEDQV